MTVSEIVARPTEAVQKLFMQAGSPTATDADWGVFVHFKEAVAALGDSEIPRLNEQTVERLPHHSLVRFHGMVQDLLNPEYYVGAFQRPNGEWVTTKFGDPDIAELNSFDSHGQPVIWERRPVMCVPVPGLSKWALPDGRHAAAANMPPPHTAADSLTSGDPSLTAPIQPASSRAAKRERSSDADAQLDADFERGGGGGGATGSASPLVPPPPPLEQEDSMQDTDLAADQGPGPGVAGGASTGVEDEGAARPRIRRREDRTISGPPVAADTAPAGPGEADAGGATDAGGLAGRLGARGSDVDAAGAVAGSEPRLAAPVEVPGSCKVFLYDNAPTLVLHEVVEIIGVVSHVPQLAALEYDNQDSLLEHELAALELTAGSGEGAAATTHYPRASSGEGATNRNGERLVFEAMRAAHPPTSKVMRVHAILVRRNPPLVPTVETPPPATAAEPEVPSGAGAAAADSVVHRPLPLPAAASLRDRAVGLLRWALGGDGVAAEYMLMQLLGRVAARGDPAALGQLTINLCRCPAPPAGPTSASASLQRDSCTGRPALAAERLGGRPGALCAALHAAISRLVPLSVALPLTVDSCNGVSWAPKRDSVRERTRPSPLQLAPGTVVLLDETVMVPGQLKAEGVASLQALMAVARQQELPYDFETFHHPVPVDLPLVLLSEGRSLLRDVVHLRLPLSATQPFPAAAEVLAAASGVGPLGSADDGAPAAADAAADGGVDTQMPLDGAAAAAAIPPAELAAVRSYLAAARAAEGYDMAEGMPAVLEQYFVDARRSEANAGAAAGGGGGGGMSAEDFHTKLTLARLLVLSHGERRLTRERWRQLLQLEHLREARLRVVA